MEKIGLNFNYHYPDSRGDYFVIEDLKNDLDDALAYKEGFDVVSKLRHGNNQSITSMMQTLRYSRTMESMDMVGRVVGFDVLSNGIILLNVIPNGLYNMFLKDRILFASLGGKGWKHQGPSGLMYTSGGKSTDYSDINPTKFIELTTEYLTIEKEFLRGNLWVENKSGTRKLRYKVNIPFLFKEGMVHLA